MQQAISMATIAARMNEIPVGAVIVLNGAIIAASGNQVNARYDPTAHAEMIVIQQAANMLQSTRLDQCDLYVTLEPCAMCAQAISHARIRRLYFGAYDIKSGGVDHGPRIFDSNACHHKPQIMGGVAELQSAQLLKDFFRVLRTKV